MYRHFVEPLHDWYLKRSQAGYTRKKPQGLYRQKKHKTGAHGCVQMRRPGCLYCLTALLPWNRPHQKSVAMPSALLSEALTKYLKHYFYLLAVRVETGAFPAESSLGHQGAQRCFPPPPTPPHDMGWVWG